MQVLKLVVGPQIVGVHSSLGPHTDTYTNAHTHTRTHTHAHTHTHTIWYNDQFNKLLDLYIKGTI